MVKRLAAKKQVRTLPSLCATRATPTLTPCRRSGSPKHRPTSTSSCASLRRATPAMPRCVPLVSDTYSTTSSDASSVPFAAQGSILFAVVGAKLSEGINFADDMARGASPRSLSRSFALQHTLNLYAFPPPQLSSSAVRLLSLRPSYPRSPNPALTRPRPRRHRYPLPELAVGRAQGAHGVPQERRAGETTRRRARRWSDPLCVSLARSLSSRSPSPDALVSLAVQIRTSPFAPSTSPSVRRAALPSSPTQFEKADPLGPLPLFVSPRPQVAPSATLATGRRSSSSMSGTRSRQRRRSCRAGSATTCRARRRSARSSRASRALVERGGRRRRRDREERSWVASCCCQILAARRPSRARSTGPSASCARQLRRCSRVSLRAPFSRFTLAFRRLEESENKPVIRSLRRRTDERPTSASFYQGCCERRGSRAMHTMRRIDTAQRDDEDRQGGGGI